MLQMLVNDNQVILNAYDTVNALYFNTDNAEILRISVNSINVQSWIVLIDTRETTA